MILAAIISVPFLTTFKNLGAFEQKEAFLMKLALILRRCDEKNFTNNPEVSAQVTLLRQQFFHVHGYRDLNDMEQLMGEDRKDWKDVLGALDKELRKSILNHTDSSSSEEDANTPRS